MCREERGKGARLGLGDAAGETWPHHHRTRMSLCLRGTWKTSPVHRVLYELRPGWREHAFSRAFPSCYESLPVWAASAYPSLHVVICKYPRGRDELTRLRHGRGDRGHWGATLRDAGGRAARIHCLHCADSREIERTLSHLV